MTNKNTKREQEVLNDVEWLSSKMNEDDSLEKEHKKDQVFVLPGFLKFIIGLLMLIMVLSWMIPSYYIKANPSPNYAPTLDEVFIAGDISSSELDLIKNNYLNFSKKNQYIGLVNDGIMDVKIVADKVSSLACEYGDNYQMCQAKALYYFVRDEFDYVPDPVAYDYIKSPLESLYSKGGDCDDATVLLSSLLGAVGIRTRLVFVPRHVYVEAYMIDAPSYYKSYKKDNG